MPWVILGHCVGNSIIAGTTWRPYYNCLPCRGIEIETRPSRLGLGRVSVVRGEGLLTGEPCIDDYIRATEPIFDYMTKWSGLVWLLLNLCTSN